MPGGTQCQLSATDHHHHHHRHRAHNQPHQQQQHQQQAEPAIYCRLTDDGVDDSAASSVDIEFNSSVASSLTSQRPAQLTRWKPVSNIAQRSCKEETPPCPADGSCE